MKTRTKDALENLTAGIEHLLDALSNEKNLGIDYNQSSLKEHCKELRTALLYETTE